MSPFHESLRRLLSGATLSGFFAQADEAGAAKDVGVLIQKMVKLEGMHDWEFDVVVTPCGNGLQCAVAVDVRWAGATPVLTVTDAEIPGLGTISAKLMIHNCLFAGTWIREGRSGPLWGNVVSQHEPKHRKRFVIERSSEFLREWWTGKGWSQQGSDARWFEHEPDAPGETDDEEARPVCYPTGEIEAG